MRRLLKDRRGVLFRAGTLWALRRPAHSIHAGRLSRRGTIARKIERVQHDVTSPCESQSMITIDCTIRRNVPA